MVVLMCPNCSASMEIDEQREFMFCQYCGTKVANLKNTVEVNRDKEVETLLRRALEFERSGDYKSALEYCTRILDIDFDNSDARELEKRANSLTGPNVEVVYRSLIDPRYKLRISFDGRSWEVLESGKSFSIRLPEGTHMIVFSGVEKYTYNLTIRDAKRKHKLTYVAEKSHRTGSWLKNIFSNETLADIKFEYVE